MRTNLHSASPAPVPAAPTLAAQTHRRLSHLVISVTRYASLELSSLVAAIRNGLEELFPAGGDQQQDGGTLYVYYRNRHGNTVTIDICVPVEDFGGRDTISGTVRRRQKGCRLAIQPPATSHGLAAAMDSATAQLGLGDRTDLPECWQVFSLPFKDFDPTAPLFVGHARNHRSGY